MCVPLWEQDRCAQQDCDKPIGKTRIVKYRRCNKLPKGTKPRNCEHLNQRGECIRLSPVKYCSKACELADLGNVFDAVDALRVGVKVLERKQRKQVRFAAKLVEKSNLLARKTRRVLKKRRGPGKDENEDDDDSDEDEEEDDDGDGDEEQGSESDDSDSMEWEASTSPV
ncbi:hypothetical protein F5X99DRAFT_378663 [Biscogniauxia marginata]|nr:hypothetical protein F5X99DRAFT_378663 [Biscogniauxia marginata]